MDRDPATQPHLNLCSRSWRSEECILQQSWWKCEEHYCQPFPSPSMRFLGEILTPWVPYFNSLIEGKGAFWTYLQACGDTTPPPPTSHLPELNLDQRALQASTFKCRAIWLALYILENGISELKVKIWRVQWLIFIDNKYSWDKKILTEVLLSYHSNV